MRGEENYERERVFVIVLDSYGIGWLPDADKFGDVGANTLATIVKSEKYDTPNMKKMGLFNIDGVACGEVWKIPSVPTDVWRRLPWGRIPPSDTGRLRE